MTDQLTLEYAISTYREPRGADEIVRALAPVFPVWRLLAQGRPVSPQRVTATVGRSLAVVRQALDRVEEIGYYDADVGAAIIFTRG